MKSDHGVVCWGWSD